MMAVKKEYTANETAARLYQLGDVFGYRNKVPDFAVALALFISFMTVCSRSVRAALKDPIKVLRYE